MAAYKKANPHKVNVWLAKRRAAKMQRTPLWADHDRIARAYKLAADFGLEVDHIVPLQGALVSGLHTHHNLQLLTPEENLTKSNRFDPWTHVHELPTPQPA
jgi:5-methylcytosine-specific restriction endonuclease McrA